MLTGSGHNTNPQEVLWFCHLCRWSGIIPAGQQHQCLKPDLDLRGPVANALGGTGDGPEHPAPPTSGRSGSTTPSALSELLGSPGEPPQCKIVAEDIEVHWYPTDATTGDRCFCGAVKKGDYA